MSKQQRRDYSLVGSDTARAIEQGLAEATWYASPVSKQDMRELLERRDGPAIRDTLVWFTLLLASGFGIVWLWGSWWVVLPLTIYGVLYATSSDSRWHECGHGTAFKTDWMNNVVYEIASFMDLRESTRWRWSHARHHSDTLIVGRDPEIAAQRPPRWSRLILAFFGIPQMFAYLRLVVLHCTGRLDAEEKTFIPESEYGKVIGRARIYAGIYGGLIALSIGLQSILPLVLIGLPALYGGWLLQIYGFTQHAGLAENVLDHRLNCRTVYVHFIHRYLYWNMNYHVEHHMFPMVPYHKLPRLHAFIKADMPTPYASLFDAWREIVPALLRQSKDPSYHVERPLPTPSIRPDAVKHVFTAKGSPVDGWVEICGSGFLRREDVLRFDYEGTTYAVYRAADGNLYATDGFCTHSNAHLADGFVSGTLVECAKHNGRFDITDGSPRRLPVCVPLRTYQAREHDGKIFLRIGSSDADGTARIPTYAFRVVSNENVATFIKELVLELEPGSPPLKYQPGDYLQFDIPSYEEISFGEIAVRTPYADFWKVQEIWNYHASNRLSIRRSYSMATDPDIDAQLRFNVRISTPPAGVDCSAGAGSTYLHRLKPGDRVTAVGPFGAFHIKPSEREMVYVGGGSGMAPLRAHLAHLFEVEKTGRRVSYWYGARSLRDVFYRDYFEQLAARCPNFTFRLALSEPRPEDDWRSYTGLIHEVVRQNYLAKHSDPTGVEYYVCGPPAMVESTLEMLANLNVDPSRIAYDEF